MSADDEKAEELFDKLILDVKALVLLHGSDSDLRTKLQHELADSHDDSLKKFVESLQSGKRPGTGRLVVIAAGELILASLLVLAGTVTLIPVMAGITTPQGLISYFAGQVYSSLAGSPFYPYTGLIEFALGALLVLSAFYTLRQAALSLKEVGLTTKTGER
ncbi:MAG: hypothetical protein OK438_02725 [Thaumarchaeota archaeon]|nr:hypothetical protein [Nitrososphaerota archaeon]